MNLWNLARSAPFLYENGSRRGFLDFFLWRFHQETRSFKSWAIRSRTSPSDQTLNIPARDSYCSNSSGEAFALSNVDCEDLHQDKESSICFAARRVESGDRNLHMSHPTCLIFFSLSASNCSKSSMFVFRLRFQKPIDSFMSRMILSRSP